MKIPETTFLKLTSKCNNNCKYCYDSKKHPDLKLSELKKLFKILYKKGAKAIVLTGGEPLLRKDIEKILREINKYNMKIYLDTSGDFFFQHKDAINKYVDTIGFPIDYASEKNFYRTAKNFKNVLKILKYYSKRKIRPKIRIGTVATKENITHLQKIGKLLKKFKIDSWKIYQFLPLGPNGFTNRKELLVNTRDFIKKTKRIEKKYSKHFKVTIATRKSRTKAYFFLSSDGTLFMPIDNKKIHGDLELGSIFDKNIVEKWYKIANLKNYENNIKKTFKQ